MKVIFTLLSLVFCAVATFAQTGTTYRLVPDNSAFGTNLGSTITATNNGTGAGGFRRSSIWRVVNSNGTFGANQSPTSGATLQIFGYEFEMNNANIDLSAFDFRILIRSEFRDINNGFPRMYQGFIRTNNIPNSTTRTITISANSSITLGWGTGTVGSTVYYCPGFLRLDASDGNASSSARIVMNTTPAITLASATGTNSILNAHAYNITSTPDPRITLATTDANSNNATRQIILTNAAPPSANITNRTVARPGGAIYTSFPFFYAASAASGGAVAPLPMRLGDFTATRQSQGVVLRWSTVQEVNSDNFEIQQSTNAQNWKTIGTVKAAGSSGSVLTYEFEDNSINSGVVYYRLKMNDLDTKFEYSSVARIQWGAGSKKLFAYPSPATTYTTISTDVAIDGAVTVVIYEMTTGRMVQQKVVNAAGNNFRLGLEGLQSGTYTVQLIKNGEILGRVNLVKQ